MRRILMPFSLVLSQRTRLHFPKFAIQALLALVVLQLPVIGYCDSGNGWFNSLFESKGKNMKGLVLTREVIIKDESDLVPEPHAMSRTDDGGFTIAGSLGRAWAIKVDSTGKVLWRNLQEKPLSGGGYATDFTGAVSMPDGSSYLCGNTTYPPGGYTPSILVHLGADGSTLKEQLIFPNERTERGIGYFDDCVKWGGNVIVVGHISQFNNIKDLRKHREQYYWILMLGADGEIKWERRIPTKFDTIEGVQSLILDTDGSFVFAAHRFNETELFRFSMTGKMIAKKFLVGAFQFVQSVLPDEKPQIYGFAKPEGSNTLFATITLNEQLEEVRRVEGLQASNFATSHAYRLPDQSLVLFGTVIHSEGADLRSGIACVDPQLQSAHKLELASPPFYDGGAINVAIPTANVGEFVVTRKLLKHVQGNEASEEARVGLALNFVQLKGSASHYFRSHHAASSAH